MSLMRTLRNIRTLGLREYAHQMLSVERTEDRVNTVYTILTRTLGELYRYIGDAKVGKMGKYRCEI